MKRIIYSIATTLLVVIILWFWFSVAKAEFNPFKWNETARSAFAYVAFLFSTGAGLATFLTIKETKTP